MDGLRACGCGRDGCDRTECVVCGSGECKWPGDCYGKCSECGSPTAVSDHFGRSQLQRADGRGPWMEMHCSTVCSDAMTARGLAEGRIVSLSDLTPERVNELFQGSGLRLEGVGPVVAS